MHTLEAPKKSIFSAPAFVQKIKNISFKRLLLLASMASFTACAAVPNEGPTSCGLESMDNALFRDDGCDPLTGIISLPSLVLVWVVDYAACGPKWHNTRVAPDFNGKKHRYLRRLHQMKIEAERDQRAAEAKKALAAQTLAENALAEHVYALLFTAHRPAREVPLRMHGGRSAQILAENTLEARFAKAFEKALELEEYLKLQRERALAATPQEQDILPEQADPGQKEESSYSILELEKAAWAQVTQEDRQRRAEKRQKRLAAQMAKWTPAQKAAYAEKQRQKAAKQQRKTAQAAQKQAAKSAREAAKQAKKQAKRHEQLRQKGELEPIPMNGTPQPAQPVAKKASSSPAAAPPPAVPKTIKNAAQTPVAPIVRKPESVAPSEERYLEIQEEKKMPIPLRPTLKNVQK